MLSVEAAAVSGEGEVRGLAGSRESVTSVLVFFLVVGIARRQYSCLMFCGRCCVTSSLSVHLFVSLYKSRLLYECVCVRLYEYSVEYLASG